MHPVEVLANRIVWALLLVTAVLAWQGRWAWLGQALRHPKTLLGFVASALLLAANWITYIWAVSNGHVVDSSLGYFITPLVNVALGYGLLGERPRRAQWLALAIAAAGVLWLTIAAGKLPWIGLVLGLTFGAYGLLRKIAVLGALEGLTFETMILAPAAVAGMAWWWGSSPTSFPAPDLGTNLWLLGLGPATTAAAAAVRLRGAPDLAHHPRPDAVPRADDPVPARLWLFDEPLTPNRLIGFALIWTALVIYTADGIRAHKAPALAAEAAAPPPETDADRASSLPAPAPPR